MNRRAFLKASGMASVAASAGRAANSLATRKPLRQAVLLMTESTRRDMLNCYRVTGVQTPSLDRIANEGVKFDWAYTCQPATLPARAAILTGQYPHVNGLWADGQTLSDSTPTIAQMLSARGIRCGFIGDWGLSDSTKAAPGWDADTWYSEREYLGELTPQERGRLKQATLGSDTALQTGFTFAHRCSSRAVDFIEKHRQEDFLLVISYSEPRTGAPVPKQFQDLYAEYGFLQNPNVDDALEGKPEEQKLWADESLKLPFRRISDKAGFGWLTFVDGEIGRVLDSLDASAPSALVMYTSPHGNMYAAHHLSGTGPAMYDEVTRVPLLVRWRGVAPGKRTCSGPASHIDVCGTFMAAFGHSPAELHGESMLASVKDATKSPRDFSFIEWNNPSPEGIGGQRSQPIRCVFDGRHKLSIHLRTSDELYNLTEDPYEMTNLIGSRGEVQVRNRLQADLLRWMETTGDPALSPAWKERRNEASVLQPFEWEGARTQ